MYANRFRRTAIAVTGIATLVFAAACGGASSSTPGAGSETSAESAPAGDASGSAAAGDASGGGAAAGGGEITLLYGASGPAETAAIDAAAAAFTEKTGTKVTATPAQDLTQQLAQGFSSGQSPDVFYVSADQFANYASAGNLLPYADSLSNADDFYPALKDSFTYEDKFYCAPKDMSTLALFINTDLWTKAGLTDADIPTTWDQLAEVSKKLAAGDVAGLTIAPERDRLGAFMVQNGAFLVDQDGNVTVNDPKNVEALKFVQTQLNEGNFESFKDLGAGWAGEAFGKGSAAMTIEGNWLLGSLQKDFPNIKYTVAELPAGPNGDKGTLVFTNCWGISATTENPDQAKAFVEAMTAKDQQLTFAKDFGVIPSIESAQADYLKEFPNNAPFVNGIEYARGVIGKAGITDVLTDFNAQLEGLASGGDPKTILDSVQQNLTDAIGG